MTPTPNDYAEALERAAPTLLLIAGPEQSNETDIVKRFRADAARLRALATAMREGKPQIMWRRTYSPDTGRTIMEPGPTGKIILTLPGAL